MNKKIKLVMVLGLSLTALGQTNVNAGWWADLSESSKMNLITEQGLLTIAQKFHHRHDVYSYRYHDIYSNRIVINACGECYACTAENSTFKSDLQKAHNESLEKFNHGLYLPNITLINKAHMLPLLDLSNSNFKIDSDTDFTIVTAMHQFHDELGTEKYKHRRDLSNLTLHGINLEDGEFYATNFSKTKMTHASLLNTWCPGTNFKDTNLSHSDLRFGTFCDITTKGNTGETKKQACDFRGADLSHTKLEDAIFTPDTLFDDNTKFDYATYNKHTQGLPDLSTRYDSKFVGLLGFITGTRQFVPKGTPQQN